MDVNSYLHTLTLHKNVLYKMYALYNQKHNDLSVPLSRGGMAAQNCSKPWVTRMKSVKTETAAFTCRHYTRPTTVHLFINLPNVFVWELHTSKKAAHMSTGLMLIYILQFCIIYLRHAFIQKHLCICRDVVTLTVIYWCVNTKVSMTSLVWSADCRGGWVQPPPLLFSCRQETKGQWIELKWSGHFNWLASQPKRLIFFSFLLLCEPVGIVKKEVVWRKIILRSGGG